MHKFDICIKECNDASRCKDLTVCIVGVCDSHYGNQHSINYASNAVTLFDLQRSYVICPKHKAKVYRQLQITTTDTHYCLYCLYVHNHIIIIKKSSSVAFKQPALHLCDLWCPRKKSRKSGILAALELIVSIYNFPQVKDFVN